MSQDNVNIIRGMYDAFGTGDVPSVLAALDPQVEWLEAENFIYADHNPYIGPAAVLEGVFMRLATEWEGFGVSPKEILDAERDGVGRGYYSGTYKTPGRRCERSSPMFSPSGMERWQSSSSIRYGPVPAGGQWLKKVR